MQVYILSDHEATSREKYAFTELFRYMPGFTLVFKEIGTHVPEGVICIIYSRNNAGSKGIHLYPSGLLESNASWSDGSEWSVYEGMPLAFPAPDYFEGEPFDYLSVLFYLLSRMEEYHSKSEDEHNRFLGATSQLGKLGLHDKAVVDWIRIHMAERISRLYGITVKNEFPKGGSFTVDVDWAFAYKARKPWKMLGASVKDVIALDWNRLKDRWAVLQGEQKDPYDTFQGLSAFGKNRLIFFLLLSNGIGEDASCHPFHPDYQKLVSYLRDQFEVGLHPSISSSRSPMLLKKEVNTFESLFGTQPTKSRQHYLILQLPATYRCLIELGISHDYSMGFPDLAGYRAGTACPFQWYDLQKEELTSLMIHPFYAMDVALKNRMQLHADEALKRLKKEAKYCAHQGLPFVLLWHNSSMSSLMGWDSWENMPMLILKDWESLGL